MLLNKDIEYTRGNTYVLDITIKGVDIINEMYMTIKKNESDIDFALQKTLSNGIKIIDKNKYRVTIEADETEDFEVDYDYGFDIKIVSGNMKKTLVVGKFIVTKNYTRRINEV